MEILFVVDNVDNIEHKISMLESFGADIKFFVHSKCVSKIIKNKSIINRVVAIYNNHINETVDKYLNDEKYNATDTLLCYSSANPTNEMLNRIRDNLQFKPSVIYIKKKLNWWSKFRLWFYQKVTKLIFGLNDEYASIKLQYFSAELMEAFKQTNFKNHIFSVPNALNIELEETEKDKYYSKPNFNKNCLYNPIVMCIVLICYVVVERLLVLQFWVYLFIIAILLATAVNWVIMVVKNTFDKRFKK